MSLALEHDKLSFPYVGNHRDRENIGSIKMPLKLLFGNEH